MANIHGWTKPNGSNANRTILPSIDLANAKLHLPQSSQGYYTERVGNYSPNIDSFGIDNATAQLVVDVPWEYAIPAIFHFLGYQTVLGTQLQRQPPLAHPRLEYMRCRHVVNVQGVRNLGDDPKQPDTISPASDFPRPHYSEYDIARMTLLFEPVPFAVKADANTSNEYERWVWVRTEPGYESLYIEGGSGSTGGNYKFDNSTGGAGKPAFAAGRNIPIVMPKVLVTWFDVPLEFIAKDAINKPHYFDNIYAALGRVNDDVFLGYPAHTLLMDSPTIDIRANPLPPSIGTTPTFLANITLSFHYLNPPSIDWGTGVTITKGHNMAIDRETFKWYPFSIDGTGGDTKILYKKSDFKKLFKKPV